MPNAAKQYQQVGAHAEVMDADPHRLIQLLMGGAIDKIFLAKGFMRRKDLDGQGANISLAISILDCLQCSLDKSAGGEMAENLDKLYEYMQRRLVEANVNKEPEILDEVTKLISTIKDGWDQIPEDVKKLAKEQKK